MTAIGSSQLTNTDGTVGVLKIKPREVTVKSRTLIV
jgi:hypothetical protein